MVSRDPFCVKLEALPRYCMIQWCSLLGAVLWLAVLFVDSIQEVRLLVDCALFSSCYLV